MNDHKKSKDKEIRKLYKEAADLLEKYGNRLTNTDPYPIFTALDPVALKGKFLDLIHRYQEIKGEEPKIGFLSLIPEIFTEETDYIVSVSRTPAISSMKMSKERIEAEIRAQAFDLIDEARSRDKKEAERERIRIYQAIEKDFQALEALEGQLYRVHRPTGDTWRAIVYRADDHTAVSPKITIKKKSGLVFPAKSEIFVREREERKRRADALPTLAVFGPKGDIFVKKILR